MNNQSPLVPQGSLLEQKNKGRARVKIAVFVVLAIHGIGLLALLMQGCKKEPESTPPVGAEDTNAAPATAQSLAEQTNTPPPFTNPATAMVDTNVTAPVQPPVVPPAIPTAAATEYKVVKGDTYTSIARKFHVTTRALQDANPGVDPAKLQIGQTLHVPAPVMSINPATTGGTELATGEQVYSVQSGDTLSKISDKFKVSVKAIQSANNLTTTRIRVGQKLKIPVKAGTATTPTTPAPGGATNTTQ